MIAILLDCALICCKSKIIQTLKVLVPLYFHYCKVYFTSNIAYNINTFLTKCRLLSTLLCNWSMFYYHQNLQLPCIAADMNVARH